jgi:hypothetical protein
VHRDRFSDKEPSPRGFTSQPVNARAVDLFQPSAKFLQKARMTRRLSRFLTVVGVAQAGCGIISGGPANVSDLTEPSEAGRRRDPALRRDSWPDRYKGRPADGVLSVSGSNPHCDPMGHARDHLLE